MSNSIVGAWQYLPERDFANLIECARAWSPPPDLGLNIRTSGNGGILTVAVLFGEVSLDLGQLFYVEGRGVYEILRSNLWPAGEVQLTLGPYSSR
jgi:hypothetical protein